MEGRNEPDVFSPGTPHGDEVLQSFAKRLDILLDDRQVIQDEIKGLKEEAKDAGITVAFLNKAVSERRKRGTGLEAAIYDAKVKELQLYYNALGLNI